LLEDELTDGLVLVLDDVHELGKRGPSARFLAALCRLAPAELHLVLVSHAEPPFPVERLRAQGAVLSIDAGMLAFTEDEVGAVLVAELGVESGELASRLYERTRGWPVAVRFAAKLLSATGPADRVGALAALAHRQGPMFEYLAEEVFRRESAEGGGISRSRSTSRFRAAS
jgi:LuxR family maltose regulon positive regulatory protein